MAINNKLQNIIDTKTAIGAAIVNKGGIITNSTPFYNYAAEIDGLTIGGGGGGDIPNYVNAVVRDTNGAKYTVRDGFDYVTNPTPNINAMPFNQWELNNSTTRPILYNNVQMEIRYYNGPNTIINTELIPSIGNLTLPVAYATSPVRINNFIFSMNSVSVSGSALRRFNLDTGTIVASSTVTNNIVNKLFEYENFIWATSRSSNASVNYVFRWDTSLTRTNFTFSGGNQYMTFGNNRAFIYSTTSTALFSRNLSDFTAIGSISGAIAPIGHNNGFLYTFTGNNMSKRYDANLAAESTINIGAVLTNMVFDNNYIYLSAGFQLQKYHEDNLTLIGTVNYPGSSLTQLYIYEGNLYGAGDGSGRLVRYDLNNLSLTGTSNQWWANGGLITAYNNIIYHTAATGVTNLVLRFEPYLLQSEQLPYYAINNIRGE